MLIIGDVHGCWTKLNHLLEATGWDGKEELAFTGDLIDRGPNIKACVDFVRNGNHTCVKGNHEDMLVKALDNEYCVLAGRGWNGVWFDNGAEETIESLGYAEEIRAGGYYDWFKNLPVMIEINDIKINGLTLLISHSFLYSNSIFNDFGIMWGRDFYINEELWPRQPHYNVFGHTPTKQPVIKDIYAMIDTGAVYAYRKPTDKNKYGLTAIRVEDGMKHTDIQIFRK